MQITCASRVGTQLARFFDRRIVPLSISPTNAVTNDGTVCDAFYVSIVLLELLATCLVFAPVDVFFFFDSFICPMCFLVVLYFASYSM